MSVYTTTFAFSSVIAIMCGFLAIRRAGYTARFARWIDVCLIALVFAFMGGRGEMIAVETLRGTLLEVRLQGTLLWHGTLWSAIIGGVLGARLRRVAITPLWIGFAAALPVMVMGGWMACASAGCAYGREVGTLAELPAPILIESADIYGIVAPRFNTPLFGVSLGLIVGVIVLVFLRMRRTSPALFPLMVLFLCVGMFGIGLLRGDIFPMIGGIRWDRWLDGVSGSVAVVWLLAVFRRAYRTRNPIQ